MKLNNIVLEAPEFGEGRLSEQRPLDVAQLSENNDGDIQGQDEQLNVFAARLRKDMLEIAMQSGKQRVKLVKDLQLAAENICAFDLVQKAKDYVAMPKDAAKLARLTSSMVSTSIFVSSLRRA